METLPIPQSMCDRIDAAHYKGLRQIMDWKTMYGQMQGGEDRTNTSEHLVTELNKVITAEKEENKQQ